MAQQNKSAKKAPNLRNAGGQAKSKSPKPKAKASPLMDSVGRELRADSKATMFGQAASAKSRLVRLEEEARKGGMRSYYKNMVLRCGKCAGTFDHEARPEMDCEVKCPHCDETHLMSFIPVSMLFTVRSDTVAVEASKE